MDSGDGRSRGLQRSDCGDVLGRRVECSDSGKCSDLGDALGRRRKCSDFGDALGCKCKVERSGKAIRGRVWSHGSGLWLCAWSHEGDRFSIEACKSSVYVRCAYGVHWHFYPPVDL